MGQKAPEEMAAASGGTGHPVNALLVWGPGPEDPTQHLTNSSSWGQTPQRAR